MQLKKFYKLNEIELKPKHCRVVDLEGKIYGKLLVIGYSGSKNRDAFWYCKCDCGNIVKVRGDAIKQGYTKSCGCIQTLSRKKGKGGYTLLPEYKIYQGAKARCEYTKSIGYKRYGGRGIKFKFKSFLEFLNHIGRRPGNAYSLDRIDVNGHYEIGNVRWATIKEQSINRRNTIRLDAFGENLTLEEWHKKTGINAKLIRQRVLRQGWCACCALTIPPPPPPPTCNHKYLTSINFTVFEESHQH